MASWENFKGLDSIQDGYKKVLATTLLHNELGPNSDGSNAYTLSNAEQGKSGWSFG